MIAPGEGFSMDISDLERGLDQLALELKKPVGEVLRERSGFFGRYLAEATFPIADVDTGKPDGGSKRARDIGQAAVKRDIARVYVPLSAMLAEIKRTLGPKVSRAFAKLVKTDPAAAERLLKSANFRGSQLAIMAWDGGALHQRKRNRRGGVNRGSKPVLVTDSAALKAYVRAKQLFVGFAKSGWINAVAQITTRGLGQVSKWIKGQAGPGSGEDRTNDESFPAVHLTNKVRYIQRAFDERRYGRVQKDFETSLAKSIDAELAALVRKRNARTAAKAAARR